MFRRSTIIFTLAAAFIAGIAFRSWIAIPLLLNYTFGLCGIVIIVLGRKGRMRILGAVILVAAISMGRLAGALQPPSLFDVSHFAGVEVTLTGIVAANPDMRMRTTRAVVSAHEVAVNNERRAVTGKILATVPAVVEYETGDVVQFRCVVKKPEPFNDFDYPRYLAKDGIYSLCPYPEVISHTAGKRSIRWALSRLKRDFITSLARVIPEPEGAFLSALLTGARGRIPESVNDDFTRTGISHLIAISGYNITIIATGILGLLTLFVRRHIAFPFLVIIISGFTVLVGGSASVVRAAVMGLMLHAAYVSDRMYKPLSGLTLVAAGMLLLNPRLLRDDLGFDLSFLATVGILLVSPHLMRRLAFIPERWKLREIIALTLAAQVTTLPLLVGSFDRVSVISPIANLMLVPWVPFLMAIGFIAGIVGVFPLAGEAVGAMVWVMAHAFLAVAHALAQVPGAALQVPSWSWTAVVALYALAIIGWWQRRLLVLLWGNFKQRYRARFFAPSLMKSKETIAAQSMEIALVPIDESLFREPVIMLEEKGKKDQPARAQEPYWKKIIHGIEAHRFPIAIGAVALLFLAYSFPLYLRSKKLEVTFFDVGQGDAALINIPRGQQALIDGGPDAGILSKLGSALPWWDRTIEYVVLTHPHTDHVTGLVEVLKRYKVEKVVMTGVAHTTDEYLAFLDEVRGRNIPVQFVASGDSFELGNGEFSVLAPQEGLEGIRVEELNGTSVVLRFAYGESSFLFMGDAPVAMEEGILAAGEWDLESNVLKVGHHGSSDANSEEFINAVAPQYAVISAGKDNPYGHPSLRTVKRLERAGATVLRTDVRGDVRFTSDGLSLYGPLPRKEEVR
ncbi:MAG: ComEC/Rec2 family competence protein [Patescibacteria group bacterium]